MKTVKVVWRWDDGDEEFLEWWTAADSLTEKEAKEGLLVSFVPHVRKHIVITEVSFK